MKHLATVILCLGLVGCGNPPTATTPAPPNSPQTTVALTVKTVADSASSCIDTVLALRNGGKLSAANARTIGDWCSFVASTDKQVSLVLVKPEAWSAQKAEILVLLGTVIAPAVATNIDPAAQAIVAQIMTLVNQIRAQVQP